MHRFQWMIQWSRGLVLDVGCQDTSGWRIPMPKDIIPNVLDIIFFDCDIWHTLWRKSTFIRGDAQHLPFKDNTFDTVVMCEVLEHVQNPLQALLDGIRISKDIIIVTMPAEYEWKHMQTTFGGIDDEKAYPGKTHNEKLEVATINLPSTAAKCDKYTKEEKLPHMSHLRWFKDDDFINLINATNTNNIMVKLDYTDQHFVNFAALLWKD